MGNQKYKMDLSFFKIAFWITVILAILKLTDKLDISLFWVFSPLILAFGLFFIITFLIGLVILYLLAFKGVEEPNEITEESENEMEGENES